jgi:tRNA(Ser,Leu) C12 N-acetylase TAN1
MQAWNVVVTVPSQAYGQARRLLAAYGEVAKTEFFNVLALQVEDPGRFLDALHRDAAADPSMGRALARVVPVNFRFLFQSPQEFETRLCEAVLPWIPRLADHSFHVRMHRRGFKGRLASQTEERFLDHFILEQLAQAGAAAQVDFDDPDFILAVESIGQQAGVSLWSREQRRRYPLLKLD